MLSEFMDWMGNSPMKIPALEQLSWISQPAEHPNGYGKRSPPKDAGFGHDRLQD